VKAEKIKDLGDPIQLAGVALDLHIRDGFAWVAENTAVIRKIDLEVSVTFDYLCHTRRASGQVEREDGTTLSQSHGTLYIRRLLRQDTGLCRAANSYQWIMG
jgi:hypothetical protein